MPPENRITTLLHVGAVADGDGARVSLTRRQYETLIELAALGIAARNEGGSSSDGDVGWDAMKNLLVEADDLEHIEYDAYADREETEREIELAIEMSRVEEEERAAAQAAQDEENAPASTPRAGADAPARAAASESQSLYDF